MGITEAIWEALCQPSFKSHDLDDTTPLYVDLYIALELLHMPYPAYIAATTPRERLLYQLYIALKSAKERHMQERIHAEADMQRQAHAALPSQHRP